MPELILKHVRKIYPINEHQEIVVLKDISFVVDQGEYIAIMGESGSGKSTLLNLIATLDQVTSGTITLHKLNMSQMQDQDSAKFRREHLGFVFQQFNLLNIFDCRDNILLPLVLAHKNVQDYNQQLQLLAQQLEITNLLTKYPVQLSGGQKQRVAVARALITNPDLILADEPTGALDANTSEKLLKMFQQINQTGQTILMVTHSSIAASHAQRVLFIKDGVIFNQLFRGSQSNQQFYAKIMAAQAGLNRQVTD